MLIKVIIFFCLRIYHQWCSNVCSQIFSVVKIQQRSIYGCMDSSHDDIIKVCHHICYYNHHVITMSSFSLYCPWLYFIQNSIWCVQLNTAWFFSLQVSYLLACCQSVGVGSNLIAENNHIVYLHFLNDSDKKCDVTWFFSHATRPKRGLIRRGCPSFFPRFLLSFLPSSFPSPWFVWLPPPPAHPSLSLHWFWF